MYHKSLMCKDNRYQNRCLWLQNKICACLWLSCTNTVHVHVFNFVSVFLPKSCTSCFWRNVYILQYGRECTVFSQSLMAAVQSLMMAVHVREPTPSQQERSHQGTNPQPTGTFPSGNQPPANRNVPIREPTPIKLNVPIREPTPNQTERSHQGTNPQSNWTFPSGDWAYNVVTLVLVSHK